MRETQDQYSIAIPHQDSKVNSTRVNSESKPRPGFATKIILYTAVPAAVSVIGVFAIVLSIYQPRRYGRILTHDESNQDCLGFALTGIITSSAFILTPLLNYYSKNWLFSRSSIMGIIGAMTGITVLSVVEALYKQISSNIGSAHETPYYYLQGLATLACFFIPFWLDYRLGKKYGRGIQHASNWLCGRSYGNFFDCDNSEIGCYINGYIESRVCNIASTITNASQSFFSSVKSAKTKVCDAYTAIRNLRRTEASVALEVHPYAHRF